MYFNFELVSARQKLSQRHLPERNGATDIYLRKLPESYRLEREKIEPQFDYHILQKDQKAERTRLLDLAMDWDCIDVAKEYLFQNSLDNILVLIFIPFSCLYY